MLASSNKAGKGSVSIAGGSKQKGTQTLLFLNTAASFLKDSLQWSPTETRFIREEIK